MSLVLHHLCFLCLGLGEFEYDGQVYVCACTEGDDR